MRATFLRAPLVASLLLAACVEETDDTQHDQVAPARLEYQDIFIPERLVEIPVLPAGATITQDVVIHNAGDQRLALQEVSLNYQSDPNWELDLAELPDRIEPHQAVTVPIHYTAQRGPDTFAALDVYSDDPDEAQVTVAFIGRSASGGPEAHVSDAIVDWGFQFSEIESRRHVELTNDGDDNLWITSVELVQSPNQPAFSLTCPGQPMEDCDFWSTPALGTASHFDALLGSPIPPGERALFEIAYLAESLQGDSAQLIIGTNDPFRPRFTVFLLGNGSNAFNCTPPEISVVSPAGAAFFHEWEPLEVSVRVHDQEQPASSLYVEMFLGDLYIGDAFPDDTGLARFSIDIQEHDPPIPAGLQTLTLRVSDGCPLMSEDVVVVGVNFPLSSLDADGDGYDTNQGDCDEGDPTVFPQAVELPDGQDNDCDNSIDEGTIFWDDDCDGHCEDGAICLGPVSCFVGGVAGFDDCNDSDQDLDNDGLADGATTYPGAEELLNFVDDDCDGTADEGTAYFDDDGDGQTELVGDCDDENDGVFIGAVEICDTLDNDCNGAIDDNCVDDTSPPRVIGGVLTDRFQVELGGRVQAQVLVVSQDEDNLVYEWSTDRGTFDEGATGSTVYWNAPEDTSENAGLVDTFPTIMVTVRDTNGVAYGFANVYLESAVQVSASVSVSNVSAGSSSCSAARSVRGPGWAALLLVGALAGARRRR